MVYTFTSMILQRLALPLALVICSLVRPVGISFAYLLMFFISPFIPVASSSNNFRGSVGPYYLILIAISSILILGHITLQIVNTIYVIGDCTFTELLLRHIGFINLSNLQAIAVVEWLLPDILMLITSVASYLIIKGMALKSPLTRSSSVSLEIGGKHHRLSDPSYSTIKTISPFFCLMVLFLAAVLRPSVPGGFYFLVFLLAGSYWASFKTLDKKFAYAMRFVMVILIVHILAIVSYQTPWTQQAISNSSLTARLIGLEPLVVSTCDKDIRVLHYELWNAWISFLNPFIILLTYYTLSLTTKNLLLMQLVTSMQHDRMAAPPCETTPLMTKSSSKISRRSIDSEILAPYEQKSSCLDQMCYGIASICGFIYQNSYIFTNILMMTWSIVYHSWLTFILLIWANVLWMIPNQRKAMMRSSPFIVFYAEILLIAQYIYGMNLSNDELPSKVNTTGINLIQIGLEKPIENQTEPCIPLIVKTLFLLMFWITLRQFFKEKYENQRRSTVSGMVAPFRLSINPATGQPTQVDKKTSKFLKKAGDVIKNLLVRLWIWLLILVIFLCAITGTKMTGFRICYMALFLFFLLVFQSSSKAWVKIMYGFWLFLIFYAMSILTLVYTYQFDKFDVYWDSYLNISLTLQKDIGLEKYETKDLFLHLVSPTIIVILTVIQVHYFHRRFVSSLQQTTPNRDKQSEPPTPQSPQSQQSIQHPQTSQSVQNSPNPEITPSSQKSAQSFHSDEGNTTTQTKLWNKITKYVNGFIAKLINAIQKFATYFKGLFWRFLEIHIIKGVYLAAFICCVSQICLLHLLFAILCVIGAISRSKMKIFISRLISFVVSIIILTKMIYQAGYIEQKDYDSNCPNLNETLPRDNNAVWFGLEKITADRGLIQIIRNYIIYLIMVTLHAVVTLRRNQMKQQYDLKPERVPIELFPGVSRSDAEKNLAGMIKYLFNYGFYRLGLEITLIMLASVIAYRQDIVAIVYVVWLLLLVSITRQFTAKIWIIFQYFIAIFILFQYVSLIGLPPGLCTIYPWSQTEFSTALQHWALLPGHLHLHFGKKLTFDFILLMFIGFQKVAFNLEKKNENNKNFPGGSNKSVVHDIESLGRKDFHNETVDFLGHVRNYLDISKNIVFCGLYWITLAMVFLTGASSVDGFSIGYLIGSFIFLWQGSDFYLLPIRVILKGWRIFLLYIVITISVKTCLQIAGCLFLNQIQENYCWLVHLWRLSCATSCPDSIDETSPDEEGICPLVLRKSVLSWDTVCFALAIFQFRIFKSHYFCHIINDTKANNILGSRGAEIIEDLRQKQIEHRKVHENEILRKIKRKMEKIRATQQKMFLSTEKPPTHFDEHGIPIPVPRQRRVAIKYHPHAVRAGDYYMFDDMDEKFELDLIDDEVDFLEDNDKIDEKEKKLSRKKSLFNNETSTDDKTDDKTEDKTDDKTDASMSEGKELKKEKSTEKQKKSKQDLERSELDETENPIKKLATAFLVAVAVRLNRWSRNYRYVIKILAEEKKVLKDSVAFRRLTPGTHNMFSHLKRNFPSEPNESPSNSQTQHIQIDTNEHDTDINEMVDVDTDEIIELEQIGKSSTSTQGFSQNSSIGEDRMLQVKSDEENFENYEKDFTSKEHHIIIEVLISTWYAILSNTDIICYIMIFINQVYNASLISLPLPLMVFLWGTLSLPRPTKTFWVTMIAYTQSLVLVKTIFQFKVIWTNYSNYQNHPLSASKIIGIELKEDYAQYDLLVLLVLFLHRFILKTQGIWNFEYQEETLPDGNYVLKDHSEPPIHVMENEHISQRNIEQSTVIMKNDDTFVLEDANALYEDEINVQVSTSVEDAAKYVPGIVKLTSCKYLVPSRRFFFNLVRKTRLPTDVYALMFLCDFVNFFVLLFGFSAFGAQQGDGDSGGVQKYLSENKVPIPFLIMLFVQFILIVIDRALYLRKALVLKIFFHFISVIGIHLWMFFLIPAVTERSFYSLTPPVVFYIIKCFYLLFSSYQIKCGYPKRILGNFLTKGFSLVNMIAFKIYTLTPFLYELRTILDWVCTDTTMTLFDWLKMEDIFADIYFIKCSRQMESDFPAIRAEKKAMVMKLLLGGFIIGLIVISIWAPLTLFALGQAVGQSNLPYQVSANIRIGPYEPIYSTNNRESIYKFDKDMYDTLTGTYHKNKLASTFLSGYDADDIATIVLAGNAPSLWEISPPDKQRLLNDLINDKSLKCRFTLSLSRIPPNSNRLATVSTESVFLINSTFPGKETMIMMLQGKQISSEIRIPSLMPKFVKVVNTDELFLETPLAPTSSHYRPIFIKLSSEESTNTVWWEIRESCNDTFYRNVLSQLPYAKDACTSGMAIYTFNDKKFPSTFNILAASGIMGLYTTLVLLFSRILKSALTGQSQKIMFVDLPNVDRVLQLCLDIYLVREALEFALEEDLFAKLIFLYRSPETMIKWTRPKEEYVNEDDSDDQNSTSNQSYRRQMQAVED